MQFSSIRRLWALIITKLLQHLTKLWGDANSRNKVCNQFQFSSLEFVQYTCNSWIYSFKNFFMYVNVFPYVTLTNFHHAALSVNKELMKGTTLTLNQLAATWGYSRFYKQILHNFTNDTDMMFNEGFISLNQQLLAGQKAILLN